MVDGYNFGQLSAEIFRLSQATDWETAQKEWVLLEIIEADEPERCLCGHTPIKEICKIENRVTGHCTEVGNVCVKRFLGVRSDLIFAGVKRIRADNKKALNADSISFFRQRGLISEWEYDFLQNTKKKRVLSQRQIETRIRINRKVLQAISRRGMQTD